ncbi:FxSxx-COOH system tetratricopeptide repeat protein [Kitasatospora sp. NPDC051853]|uniref:FxSxx-COOH system tetratricopeptide repeat protein n=1 Tax=Kitasatospora sp. NPDC051853 TaxID=3364058 RepID=UPI0037A5B38C
MTISTGDVVHAAPRTPAPWPHQVGRIPPRAGSFQDRAEAVRLAAVLEGGGTAVVGPAGGVRAGGVLTGLGGVGKTQLAADYARTAWGAGELDVLVWITAAGTEAVVAGYAQAGAELLGAEPEVAAQAFLAWLEPKPEGRPCRWLVVLDDVADPDDLRGWWPPQSPHGRTLVTTRRRDAALAGAGRRLVEVGLFTGDESLAYLAAALAAHGRQEPEDELRSLATDLGNLPLALSQAAAYLIDAGLSCVAYRALLADSAGPLADTASTPLPDDQTHAVSAAWTLSVERANALQPVGLAAPMLSLAAFLDPNGIPEPVLTSAPALTHLALTRGLPAPGRRRWWWPRRRRSAAAVTQAEAVAALRVLHRLGLITHDPDTAHQAVRVHQLVQWAVRDTLDRTGHGRTAHTAADALLAAWPDIEYDTALARALRANTTILTNHASDTLHQPAAHKVLFCAGHSLGDSGQAAAARDYFQHMVDTTTHRHGPAHPDALAARHNLASWRGQAGDAVGAAAAFEELLADQLRVFGPDNPDTLTARHNLAFWRGEAGDVAGAVAALEGLLADRLRVLGPDHPQTLTARSNLAYWRGEAGDVVGAVAAFEELLADRLRVLGPDHPDTLTTRHNLASNRGAAGDAAGAVAAFEELLADQLRVSGPDHPDTLTARNELARWRGEAGDVVGAAAAFEELLADQLRVLGPDHPDTLTTRHSLAACRGEMGDAAGAVAALEGPLADRLRVLGPDHPQTLTARSNLAYWRGEAGDVAGAVAAFEELLADRLRVLGPDHPDTLTTRHDLAHWQGETGDVAGADDE